MRRKFVEVDNKVFKVENKISEVRDKANMMHQEKLREVEKRIKLLEDRLTISSSDPESDYIRAEIKLTVFRKVLSHFVLRL